MPKRRKPKTGEVYLLKSDQDVYKYGCSQNFKDRIKAINYRYKEFGHFDLLFKMKSKDIYKHENHFRWFLHNNHIPIQRECFPDWVPEYAMIEKMKQIIREI